MISRITGILIETSHNGVVLVDVHGIGYEIHIPLSSLSNLSVLPNLTNKEAPVTFLIHQIIREDAHLLFGFITEIERSIFQLLIKVNGVGPKIALLILSGLTINEFFQIIETSDSLRLSKIPGIGKKTADRLILELTDKISSIKQIHSFSGFEGTESEQVRMKSSGENKKHDAILALVGLGYKLADAEKMINKISTADSSLSIDDLIKMALKNALR